MSALVLGCQQNLTKQTHDRKSLRNITIFPIRLKRRSYLFRDYIKIAFCYFVDA